MCVVGEKVSEKVETFLYHAKLELTRPFPQRSTGAPQGQECGGAAARPREAPCEEETECCGLQSAT